MLNIGTGEIIVIAVVALLVLGPQRLPELARGIGKFMREFRRQTDEVRGVVEREFYKMDNEINAAPPVVPQAAPGLVPMGEASQQNGPHDGLVPPALQPTAAPAPRPSSWRCRCRNRCLLRLRSRSRSRLPATGIMIDRRRSRTRSRSWRRKPAKWRPNPMNSG